MTQVLMLAGDFVEDYEVMVPYQALSMVGIHVAVACPGKQSGETIKTAVHDFLGDQTYTEKPGHLFTLNATLANIRPEGYDGLYITGGRAPEYIRLDTTVLNITKYFMNANKPVAAICHGIQVLTAANVVTGRKLTAYPAVSPEITLAGGTYIPMEPHKAMTEGNLVTAPAWPAHPAILQHFLQLLMK